MFDWGSLIAQVPLVAAFIYFSLESNKRFQQSMDKRDDAYLSMLAKIDARMDAHDLHTRQAIAQMEERTRPRPSSKDQQ